jgi:hypothetical protein
MSDRSWSEGSESYSSVPHPFRVFCEMGGKPLRLEVRAFTPIRQKKVARMGHGSWPAIPRREFIMRPLNGDKMDADLTGQLHILPRALVLYGPMDLPWVLLLPSLSNNILCFTGW